MNEEKGGIWTEKGIVSYRSSLRLQFSFAWAPLTSGVFFKTELRKVYLPETMRRPGLSFSLLLATLTVGSTLGGKMQNRYEPRVIVILGGLILTLGFFLASFVTPAAPWLLWLTYGVMGGVGMGFTYSTTIACAQRWYPDKRGFITGIIVAALGFGGVLFTPIIELLIQNFGGVGMGELKTFRALSLIFAVVCTIGGFFVTNPPKDYVPEGYIPPSASSGISNMDYSPGQVLRMPQFYLITASMMLACMGGS